MTEICLALMRRLARDANLRRSVRSLARRGPIPGFGHPLYPDADPRAEAMIAASGWPPGWRRTVEIIREETGAPPSLDFGLALTAEQLRLPPAAGLAIFAVGRTAGWIAHAVEQRQDGRLIRPRATATPPPPR
jgi:citrate synthase